MLCYKDRTFCKGGSPLCSKFSTCDRAATERLFEQAKSFGLPVSLFVAPESMPCYAKPAAITLPESKRPTTRPKAKVEDFTESQWRAWFDAKTPCNELARKTKISAPTIRKHRDKLGYPAIPAGGYYRQKYTREDAERIALNRKPGETLEEAGKRCGYAKNTAKEIARRFRDILPPTYGFREAKH